MGLSHPPTRADIQNAIEQELERAYAKHGRERWGRHEWYAITLEELDEAWDIIKGDGPSATLQAEIVQIAAMCYRYLETGDRYRDAPTAIEHRPIRARDNAATLGQTIECSCGERVADTDYAAHAGWDPAR